MNITKHDDHYLFTNDKGTYHFSLEEYDALGEKASIEKATSEILKKFKSQYSNKKINFDQARSLGFCEYGIKDFCTRLDLDLNKEYSLDYLKDSLTLEVFKKYPNECIKLFSKDIINKFGGIIGLLTNFSTDSDIFYLIIDNFIKDDIIHKFSVKAAYYSIKNYEDVYPNDDRPRKAIEAKEAYLQGLISIEELESAAESAAESAESAAWSARSAVWSASRSAAWSAESAESAAKSAAWSTAWSAESAAKSAAWSAESAAESAARSAAWSAESVESAARSAAWSAESAESAAESVAYDHFSKELIDLLKGELNEI